MPQYPNTTSRENKLLRRIAIQEATLRKCQEELSEARKTLQRNECEISTLSGFVESCEHYRETFREIFSHCNAPCEGFFNDPGAIDGPAIALRALVWSYFEHRAALYIAKQWTDEYEEAINQACDLLDPVVGNVFSIGDPTVRLLHLAETANGMWANHDCDTDRAEAIETAYKNGVIHGAHAREDHRGWTDTELQALWEQSDQFNLLHEASAPSAPSADKQTSSPVPPVSPVV